VSPSITQAQLQTLRLKYNAAYTAYRSCVDALSKASVDGGTVSPALLKNEAIALRDLTETRAALLATMPDGSDETSA
jgi:hypothetical protein